MDDGLKVRADGGIGRQTVEIDSRLDAHPPPGGAAAESGRHAVGDAVQSGADQGLSLYAPGLAGQDQEGGLERIFRLLRIVKEPTTDA